MNRQQAEIIVEQWETRSDEIICDHNGELRLPFPEGMIIETWRFANGLEIPYAGGSGWITEQTYENAKRLLAVTADQEEEKPIARRDRQIDKIIKCAKTNDYNLMAIPEGGKAEIKKDCLLDGALFTDEGFNHAWKEAKKRGLIEIANKEKYT